MFSNHNGMKLGINNKREFGKSTNTCILNDTLKYSIVQKINHKDT